MGGFREKKAETYSDYKFNPIHRIGLTNYLRQECINEFLAPIEGATVLDVGCASGKQLLMIASKCKSAVGVDISQNFINKANQNKEKRGAGERAVSASYC